VAAPAGSDAQQSTTAPKWTPAIDLYTDCLTDLGLRGDYTWTDGGKSAIRLADACKVLGKAVIQECLATMLADEKLCQAINTLYAQTALKALHK
jgi:hypothetical protein